MSTVTEIIEVKLQKKLEEKKGSLNGVVVLDITGDEGGQWTINCDDVKIEKTNTENPTVRIIMTDEDFKAMIEGELNAMTAMFSGKLKIEGDMAMASKLAMAIK